jgi:Uma2 family endonuclease
VRGEIQERNVGEYEHSTVQWAILNWFRKHDKAWETRSLQEQWTLYNSENVRVPDVSVWRRKVPVRSVFDQPQLIVVEILSPEDGNRACRSELMTSGVSIFLIHGSSIPLSG